MSWFDTVSHPDGVGPAVEPERRPRLRPVAGASSSARPAGTGPSSSRAARRTRGSSPRRVRPDEGARGTAFQVGAFAGGPALRWHVAEPGPALAGLLAELDHESVELLDDYDVVEFVAAAERVASWAHHLAARGAAELSRRKAMTPPVDVSIALGLTSERVAGAELGLRLGISSRAGQDLVGLGLAFRGCLSPTGDALAAGRIDVRKARAVAEGLHAAPTELAVAVQDAVLPRAPGRTARQLAGDVRAALVQLDPTEAAGRHAEAAKSRYLARPVPLPDGMAGLWLRTTAPEAQALYAAVDEAARSARRAGDPRTLDQLRADLICQGHLHDGGSRSRVKADVRVLVPLSTLLGSSDEPGELAGYGPIDPVTARALARGGTWRRLVTDPATGTVLDVGRTRYQPPADLAELVRHRDRTCVNPTCDTSAWSCELDHTVPFDRNGSEGGPTAAHNLGPLSKNCHLLKTHAGFDLEQLAPGEFRWTTPTGHRYTRDPEPPVFSIGPPGVGHVRGDFDELTIRFSGIFKLPLAIDESPRAVAPADVDEDGFPLRKSLRPRETRIIGFGTECRESENVFNVFEFHAN